MLLEFAVVLSASIFGSLSDVSSGSGHGYSVVAETNTPLLGTPAAIFAPGRTEVSVNPAAFPYRSLVAAPAPVAGLRLASLSGTPLLKQLGLMSKSAVGAFVGGNPETVTRLLAAPPAAKEVSRWWTALGEPERSALLSGAPQVVGALDGVPAELRSVANRSWIEQSRSNLETTIASSSGRAILEESRRRVHMLQEIESVLGATGTGPARGLLSVDPSGQGRAAVVLGDLATADYVTYVIPGMFFTVEGQIGDWTDDAARVYDEQVEWLHAIGRVDTVQRAKTVAVVAWMGYETPNLTNIGSIELAEKGRDAIARAVEGLQAERAGDLPYISVIAHSYGSTAALMALTEYNFSVDALAVIGSPGSAAQSVDDLHVRNGNVWVGEAAWDPVPNSAYFGSDPGADSYGAHRLNVDGGIDSVTKKVLTASIGHNGYFGAGSESVRNLALIGIGQSQLVTDGSKSDHEKTLALVK